MYPAWLLWLYTIYADIDELPRICRFSFFHTRTLFYCLSNRPYNPLGIVRLLIAMLQVTPSSTQEKSSVSAKRAPQWFELGLRWILADGQLLMSQKLPFCVPGWRAAALIAKANPMDRLIHHDQSLGVNKIDEEDVGMSNRADSNFLALGARVEDARDVDRDVLYQTIVEGNVKMDVRIWSALPEDIIEKILARLPLPSVLRFRSVCRRWKSVLLSGSFLSSHSKSSLHRHSCFLLCTVGQFACTFDPSLGKWLTLLKPTSPGASVVASTGSLFCLGNQVTECRVLSVCNPITRSLRRLPAMCRLRLIHKITMFEDQGTNGYTIVVAGEDGLPTPNPHNFNLITEVYHSNSNKWCAAKDPLPDATFGSDPGVWFEGVFYCLTELPFGMVKFSAEEGIWEEVSVAMPPFLAVPTLVTVKGRLLMVGRCGSSLQGKGLVVRIWELVRKSKDCTNNSGENEDAVTSKEYTGAFFEYEWLEVLEMPSTIRSKFLAPLAAYAPLVCAGIGSSIFITTHMSPKVLVLDVGIQSANAASRWSWLPQDPLFPKQRDFHLVCFPFEPRFDASP